MGIKNYIVKAMYNALGEFLRFLKSIFFLMFFTLVIVLSTPQETSGATQGNELSFGLLFDFTLDFLVILIIVLMVCSIISIIIFLIIKKINEGTTTGEVNLYLHRNSLVRQGLITLPLLCLLLIVELFMGNSINGSMVVTIKWFVFVIAVLLINQIMLNFTKYEISKGEIEYWSMADMYVPWMRKDKYVWFICILFNMLLILIETSKVITDENVHDSLALMGEVTIGFMLLIWFIFVCRILILGVKKIFRRKRTKVIESFPIQIDSISQNEIENLPIHFRKRTKKDEKENKKSAGVDIVYKVDLSTLFPEESTAHKICIEDMYLPFNYNEKFRNNGESDKFLILSTFQQNREVKVEELKLHISYEQNQKFMHAFFHLFICFREVHGIIIPTQKYVYDHYKRRTTNAINTDFIKFYSSNKMPNLDTGHRMLLSGIRNMCVYNDLGQQNILLDTQVADKRKVIAHVKTFGVGKTTYDVGSTVGMQKNPVLISAWEANYDHDILHLIFTELKKETNTKTSRYGPKGVLLVFLGAILVVINSFVSIANIVGGSDNILFTTITRPITTISDKFSINPILLIVVGIGGSLFLAILILWEFFAAEFLIFKKNNTQVYKEFYLKNIVSMLELHKECILVIEDVDRLQPEVINEVFRILSSINSRLPKQGRIIALISYSDEKLKEKLKENDTTYAEIENKVIYSKLWGQNYDACISMQLYCRVNIEVYINYVMNLKDAQIPYDMSTGLKAIDEAICNNQSNINFRDLHTILDEQLSIENLDEIVISNLRNMTFEIAKKIKCVAKENEKSKRMLNEK